MTAVNGFEWMAGKRAALVIGHPGHELRVHGWMEMTRPDVVVLTDGSGGAGVSRLPMTERSLASAGAKAASVFGEFTDRRVYDLIINQRWDGFLRVVDRLVSHLRAYQIEYVIGDAYDTYNPTHDLCRMLIGASLERLRRCYGISLPTFDFNLCGLPNGGDAANRDQAVNLSLDPDSFRRKVAAINGYGEWRSEVLGTHAGTALDAFRDEWLRPAANETGFFSRPTDKPFYEAFGEQQVAGGRYREVLRFARHMRPLADALWHYATSQHRRAA